MSDKKKSILDVAERLIALNGYRSTTTRMIADEAGVNIAMLSYYFGSKEQLLKALIDRHTAEMKRMLEQITGENHHPIETLKRFYFAYLDYSFENPRPVIIAIREIGLLNQRPEILKDLQKTMLEVHGMSIETLEKAKNIGSLRNIDIELTVLTFSSTIESYLVNAFMFEQEFPFLGIRQNSPEVMKERVKTHISNMISQLQKDF